MSMNMRTNHKRLRRLWFGQDEQDTRGFTIVELMIATLVFSLILTIVTTGVLLFTNRFYKGEITSATQNDAQTIIDTVGQAIQFGTGAVELHLIDGYFCAGGLSFTFDRTGAKFTGAPGQRGVYVSSYSGPCAAKTTGGRQLLGKNMRLNDFFVASDGSLRTITVAVAYGDNDLLCRPDMVNCNNSMVLSNIQLWTTNAVACRSSAGSQFCAVSRLQTAVQKRI